MKKIKYCSLIMTFVMIFSAALTGLTPLAKAAGTPEIVVMLNDTQLNIPPSFGAPYYDGQSRLQIPLRYIVESCGYSVAWDSATKTAIIPTLSGDVRIAIGSKILSTPSGNTIMDTSAIIKDDRTYIPLRFALEALDFSVGWNRNQQRDTVTITGKLGKNAARTVLTATQVSAQASPAVFLISVYDIFGNELGTGSGFFIDPSGIGVTNYHVIGGASSAIITMQDGTKHNICDVLHYDTNRDIVVFSAKDVLNSGAIVPLSSQPYLNMASPSSINNGDICYAIGSPLGMQNSITDGLISNKNRKLFGTEYIQTSAPISMGNSGGPLLNQFAEVVGINTATLVTGQNLNLAVPVSSLSGINLSTSGSLSFPKVYEKEFRSQISSKIDFAENFLYEDDSSALFPLQRIQSGDTFMGTFAKYYSMDYYSFYTPIPVNAEIVSGGFADNPAKKHLLNSFVMTLDKEYRGDTYLEPKYLIDGGGNPFCEMQAVLEPGYYYICVLQSIDDENAWKDLSYFVYLTLTPTN